MQVTHALHRSLGLACLVGPLVVSSLAACEHDERLSDRTFSVEDPRARAETRLSVREEIVLHPTIQDPVIERRYTLGRGSHSWSLGGYEDEAREGLTIPPRVVGDTLVVMSGAHVALVRDASAGAITNEQVRWFSPYDAACFDRATINGHYDVRARSVSIEGAQVRLEYGPSDTAIEGSVGAIHFTSRDGGRSFVWDECPASPW
ncbi:MAG: hypothetical protein K1X94_30360 [Sandaracinaceae bacterium]|nr:hypothetical protein [Sandaracinaceae bacterium]